MTGGSGDSFDVVVLGSGAAGLAAALVAATEGLRVCLLEKAALIGGTTAWSGGMVWAPGSGVAREAGYDDSPDAVQRYLTALVPGAEQDSRMAAFLRAAPEAVDYLASRTQVRLRPVPVYPDYYPELDGATDGGRVLEPEPFDATVLGDDLKLLHLPLPEFALFGDMMLARPDIPHFRSFYKSPVSLLVALRLLSRHSWQKIRYGRGTSLVLGNALVARFLVSLRSAGVVIRTEAEVAALIQDGDGAVQGVRLSQGGELEARYGVVLATGGFTHDPSRRRRFLPGPLADNSATAPGATGDGARFAEAIGGQFSEGATGNAFWAPVSRYTRPDGSTATYPHTVTDRAKPGLIAVNGQGRRFVNEAISYHAFVQAMLADHNTGAVPDAGAWLICDAGFLWKYGLGAVKPMSLNRKGFMRQGYLVEAPSIEVLEDRLSLPAGDLVATVETYNRHARTGSDPAFERGSDSYQRFLGDPAQSPNPCIAPIEKPPFFAIKVRAGDLGSAAGLTTDETARVLDDGGVPIPGLYAVGADMRSVMEGSYPGPGITLGPAIAFAYLAAMDMVEKRSVAEDSAKLDPI